MHAVGPTGWAGLLGLRAATVDVAVSDLPFGKRCLGVDELPRLYARLLSYLARVLVPGTGRAVLMTGQMHLVLGPAGNTPFWEAVTEVDKLMVRHGPGKGWVTIVVLRRTKTEFAFSRSDVRIPTRGSPGTRISKPVTVL